MNWFRRGPSLAERLAALERKLDAVLAQSAAPAGRAEVPAPRPLRARRCGLRPAQWEALLDRYLHDLNVKQTDFCQETGLSEPGVRRHLIETARRTRQLGAYRARTSTARSRSGSRNATALWQQAATSA